MDRARSELLGPYRLLQRIGEGGMGEVWEAEQTDPVRRRVALKLIKRGMDTKRVVARFEAERQALAMMDHPAVAKVLDAGATPEGRPYFVMERVYGHPITRYCDQHRLTIQERLELFQQVCAGVQHAHQKAIIHRDLKPFNVLVSRQDGKPVPKIIDFGVAKAISQNLTEQTLFTELGALIGTPEYMSPEQAHSSGQDVDTRTDVYSLGVILYELLVGALPFEPQELRREGFEGILRKIREEEPPKPSTRLSLRGEESNEAARNRRVDLQALRRQVRGDLDWIVMKALEKDPGRRYESPKELSSDVGRFLTSQPVSARPPSLTYRASKFMQRHRLGVGAGVTAILMLVSFAATMTVQANRIARERDRANSEAEAARQVSDFLVELFEVADPTGERASSVTAKELLDEGSSRIERELGTQPLVQARLMNTMGVVYQNLGLADRAERLLEASLAMRTANLGERHPDVVLSLSQLGWLRLYQGRLKEAEALERRALALAEEQADAYDLGVAWASYRLGVVLGISKRFEEAATQFGRAQRIFEERLGPESRPVAWCVNDLGNLHVLRGQYAEAEPLLRRSIEIKKHNLGPDHSDVAMSMNNLSECLMHLNRLNEARALAEDAVAMMERSLGSDHPRRALHGHTLGEIYRRLGLVDRARVELDRALTVVRSHGEIIEPDVECAILGSQAQLEFDSGDYPAAETKYQEAISLRSELFGPDDIGQVDLLQGYAKLLLASGREAEADKTNARIRAITSGQDSHSR